MAEVNWQRVFATSSLIFALLLICGSIYLHLQQKNHLGRLRQSERVVSYGDIDAASDLAIALPIANEKFILPETTTMETRTMKTRTMETTTMETRTVETTTMATTTMETTTMATTTMRIDTDTNDYMNYADDSDEESEYNDPDEIVRRSLPTVDDTMMKHQVTESCLQCICETATKCLPSKCANNKRCGLFRISRPYWTDAGSPQLADKGQVTDIDDLGYHDCINNANCAARTSSSIVEITSHCTFSALAVACRTLCHRYSKVVWKNVCPSSNDNIFNWRR